MFSKINDFFGNWIIVDLARVFLSTIDEFINERKREWGRYKEEKGRNTERGRERLHCCKRVVHLNFRSPENRAVESP